MNLASIAEQVFRPGRGQRFAAGHFGQGLAGLHVEPGAGALTNSQAISGAASQCASGSGPETGKGLVVLTDNLALPPLTIARPYKCR